MIPTATSASKYSPRSIVGTLFITYAIAETPHSSGGNSVGLIVGIVTGGLLTIAIAIAIAIIIYIVWCCKVRRG